MSGDEASTTFKRCRSAIDVTDPVLRKIAREINFAEKLLRQYLQEASEASPASALGDLFRLVDQELRYLRKVKESQVVSISGSFVTFRSDDGEFLVTVVPEDELQRHFHPLFCLESIKPRFATPVASREKLASASQSTESVYYDAYDFPVKADGSFPRASTFGRTIYGLLNYIFASTMSKLEKENS